MNRSQQIVKVAFLVPLLLLATSSASRQMNRTRRSQLCVATGRTIDAAQFQSVMERIAQGWNRGDAEQAASCFTETAVFSGPPSTPHRGRRELFDWFSGAKGRELPMHMEWHHLLFDQAQQIGVGEFTFRYRIQTHGSAIVKVSDGLIVNWREYEVESSLPWDRFVGENRF